ncbi:MAG: L-threonylcarbamoyladenylate synthase [Actinomycetota bacterium]
MKRIDALTDRGRQAAADTASDAVNRGEVIVIPTDTVYGVGADAFSPAAVAALLAAKGRGRSMPPPVLVPTRHAVDALAYDITEATRELVAAFWPGPLTLVCHAQPTLAWDLGDTHGTVALRMPLHRVALAVLARTGPLAVTSANRTGRPPAVTVEEAVEQLGDAVSIYVDAGPSQSAVASTVVDVTADVPVLLRRGPITDDQIRAITGELQVPHQDEAGPGSS